MSRQAMRGTSLTERIYTPDKRIVPELSSVIIQVYRICRVLGVMVYMQIEYRGVFRTERGAAASFQGLSMEMLKVGVAERVQ